MTMLREDQETQNRIAHACKTTVLTLMDCHLHTATTAVERLVRGITNDPQARFNLLTCMDFGWLSRDTIQILANDISAAVSLHHAERLLLYLDEPHRALAKALERELGPKVWEKLDVNVALIPEWALGEKRRLKGMIISCMDFRMHGSEGGLLAKTAETFGIDLDAYGILATAGGAKELTSFDLRRLAHVKDNMPEDGEEIILLSHTDCGKYGGDAAFKSGELQISRLRHDLHEAMTVLRTIYPSNTVRGGIVHLDGGKVGRIERF